MSKLIEYLRTDPEIVALREAYKEVTGRWLGYHWEEFGSIENYKQAMRETISEHKKQQDKQNT